MIKDDIHSGIHYMLRCSMRLRGGFSLFWIKGIQGAYSGRVFRAHALAQEYKSNTHNTAFMWHTFTGTRVSLRAALASVTVHRWFERYNRNILKQTNYLSNFVFSSLCCVLLLISKHL